MIGGKGLAQLPKLNVAGSNPVARSDFPRPLRALKLHGGADAKQLGVEDVAAVQRGLANL